MPREDEKDYVKGDAKLFTPKELLELIDEVLDGQGLVVTDTDLLEEAIWESF